VLDAVDGVPKRIRTSHSARPPAHEGRNSCSELQLHPAGHTLYVGNRGADCVAVFSVDGTGDLGLMAFQASRGRSPRAVRRDPSGRYLMVGNRNTGTVAVFQIGQSPPLVPVGEPVAVPAPSSFAFVPADTATA
jgi:6-phosphogluconolactonase